MPGRLSPGIPVLVCGLAACLPGLAGSEPSIDRRIEEQFGTVLAHSKWPNPLIKVCIENPEALPVSDLSLMRAALAETWEKDSQVRFQGWQACVQPKQDGLHIKIGAERPHTKAVGRYLNQQPEGMVLNFAFVTWRPDCASTRELCVKALTAHEFGHALGFTHEQLGPLRQPECVEEPEDILGDYLVTDYDSKSIMSYCNPKWNGDGRLSNLDKRAVQTFYGS